MKETVINDVPELNVRPVVVPRSQCEPAPPVRVIVDAPSVRVRVLLFDELKNPNEQVWPLVRSVPRVRLTECVVSVVTLSWNCHVPPAPLNVMDGMDFPAVVIRQVPDVEVKSIRAVLPAAVVVNVIPATNLYKRPATVMATRDGCERVPVNPVQSNVEQTAPDASVTVTAPDAASRKTSSEVVGAAAPEAPPEVVDHLLPAVPSHVAEPPTQYLAAMRNSS